MFDHIGLPEILIILVIVFIFFGAGKLPEVASGLGKAVRNFKKAQRGDFDEEEKSTIQETASVTSKAETPKLASSAEITSKSS